MAEADETRDIDAEGVANERGVIAKDRGVIFLELSLVVRLQQLLDGVEVVGATDDVNVALNRPFLMRSFETVSLPLYSNPAW